MVGENEWVYQDLPLPFVTGVNFASSNDKNSEMRYRFSLAVVLLDKVPVTAFSQLEKEKFI